MHDRDLVRATGILLGSAGPLAVAGLLAAVRDKPVGGIVAFVLMAGVVGGAGMLAGFAAGLGAAVMATMSFDFFFVRPYVVLELDTVDDLRAALVFAAVGLGAAALSHRVWPFSANHLGGTVRASRHVQRVLGLIKQGADPRDLLLAVQAELTSLLRLRGCRFEAGAPLGRRPRLGRDGVVLTADGVDIHGDSDFALPAEDLELPVQASRRILGVFVLQPTPGASVPLEHRLQAVLLADRLAGAVGSHRRQSLASEGGSGCSRS